MPLRFLNTCDTRSEYCFHANQPSLSCAIPSCPKTINESLSLEGSWETLNVLLKVALVGQELNVSTIDKNLSGCLLLHVLLAAEWGETPVL